MKVYRKVLIPTRDGVSIWVTSTYCRNSGVELLQYYFELVKSDTFGDYYQRFSPDNGKTWSEPEVVFKPQATPEGILRWGENAFFVELETGVLIHFYNYCLHPGGHFTIDARKYFRIFYRISKTGGKTWSEPKQVIQKGYNETNWAEGVFYGKNGLAISFCRPIKLSNGKILLPVQMWQMNDENKSFLIQISAGCMVGELKNDGIEFGLSKMITVDKTFSTRGLFEPAIEELRTGNLLMICRSSNASACDKISGRKWFSLSFDKGFTWSTPKVLKYDTNEDFYSPSTGSVLIRNSKTKKLYWFSNILSSNPDGNLPRYPLQISEIDESTAAVIKSSLTVIDDKSEFDYERLQLSNFKVYEDRITNEFVLILSRINEKGKELTSPAYEYRVKLD